MVVGTIRCFFGAHPGVFRFRYKHRPYRTGKDEPRKRAIIVTKTFILGLDGVPRQLLVHLADTGVMPGLGRWIARGSLHDLEASIPEISSVNWSSFMTGVNPGTHGIFGFTDLVPGTLSIRFPRFADLAAPTFWDRLGEKGVRSVVVNQPSTYPARPVPGALVAGFVALDLDRAVYPARHLARIEALGYQVDVDSRRARTDHEYLLGALHETLEGRARVVDYLWREESWDVFQVVVTGTDRLQHFLWHALEDEDHPLHARVLDYYRAVDALAVQWVDRFRNEYPGGAVWALSDHGFTRIQHEVRLNAWLQENGYLAYAGDRRAALRDLAPSTRVFALDPGRLHLREPSESLKDELIGRLQALTHEGRPVIRAVHRREAIYTGPLVARAPDLVVQAHDGFDLKGTLQGDDVFVKPTTLTGMHNPDAFVLADRPQVDGLNIADLAALIEAPYA